MTPIQTFNFENHFVRVVEKNDEPWWIAKDVCAVLGLDTSNLTKVLDDDELSTTSVQYTDQARKTNIINEPGLYSLIIRSRKPEAKAFKRWITHEVLPAIRKTGGYLSPTVDFSNPDNVQKILDAWRDDREKLVAAEMELENQKPKIDYYNLGLEATNGVTLNVAAKIIKAPNVGEGNLRKALRNYGIFMPNNIPYERYIKGGWFKVIEKPGRGGDGVKVKPKVLVTAAGLRKIFRLTSDITFSVNGPIPLEQIREGREQLRLVK